jgi:hypothetical protein
LCNRSDEYNEIYTHWYSVTGVINVSIHIVILQTSIFHEDIYPPTASQIPSLSADEWISGQTRGPILMSMLVSSGVDLKEPRGGSKVQGGIIDTARVDT